MNLALKHIAAELAVEGPRKPVIVLSNFWMRWIAGQLGVSYSKEIDTGYILYIEQVLLR